MDAIPAVENQSIHPSESTIKQVENKFHLSENYQNRALLYKMTESADLLKNLKMYHEKKQISKSAVALH